MAAADSFDARKRRQLGQELVKKKRLAGIRIARLSQGNIESNGVLRIKAGLDDEHVDHAADQQSGPNQQGESHGCFRHAGTSPKMSAVAAESSIANASTRPLRAML